MAEWSNAAVLKTVEGHTSGGSNPSFSAEQSWKLSVFRAFLFQLPVELPFPLFFNFHSNISNLAVYFLITLGYSNKIITLFT